MNFKSKEKFQEKALQLLKNNNYSGSVIGSTGSGKSKAAIDCIKQGNFKNILITSPRTNLKESWRSELEKWGLTYYKDSNEGENYYWYLENINWKGINITLENIQTCYKWVKEQIQQFDLIVIDEIHTVITPEYGQLLIKAKELNISIIGLTATPDIQDKPEKLEFYNKYCPILIEYYNSAIDGLVNNRKYWIYQYELTDDYKIIVGNKKKKWEIGEKSQYSYLTENIKKGQRLMANTGSTNWFEDAANWFWKNNTEASTEQKSAARIYLQAIKYRKEFLWNLNSSASITLELKEKILWANFAQCKISKNFEELSSTQNKVLLFSELTSQTEKLSSYFIHSKQDQATNQQILYMFDEGKIRELASCNSLTLGLNIVGVNWEIFESFNGSNTNGMQKLGRSDRLDTSSIANIVFIVPIKTQAEEWFKSAFNFVLNSNNYQIITNVNELIV